jgi:hypothetical protein
VSQFDIPRDAAIRKAALANRAVQACIAKPLAGHESLCTEKAILDGRPVVLIYAYGYVSTSAFDAEDGTTVVPQLGELQEIRPLRADDAFHPNFAVVVFDAKKFPRTARYTGKPTGGATGERTRKPAAAHPIDTDTDEDTEELARSLGLIP